MEQERQKRGPERENREGTRNKHVIENETRT